MKARLTAVLALLAFPVLAVAQKATFTVHNNTDATIQVQAFQLRGNGRTKSIQIRPGTYYTFRNAIPRGNVRIEVAAPYVRGVVPITQDLWVSGQATRVLEWEIFPDLFGKSFMADAPGARPNWVDADSPRWEGQWKSDVFGTLTFSGTNEGEVGRYTLPSDYPLFGSIVASNFSGFWVQRTSRRKCLRMEYGSWYWGRLELRMDASGQTLSGHYDYCGGGTPEGRVNTFAQRR